MRRIPSTDAVGRVGSPDIYAGYDTRLRNMSTELNGRLGVEAQEITTLAQGVARLNDDIAVA